MSESEKYRAIGAGATFIFVLVALLGIGVIVAVVSLLPKDINGGAAFGVMIGMSLPTIAALFLLTRGMDRRHARRVGRRLAPDGFTLIDAPTLEQQTTVLVSDHSTPPARTRWRASGGQDLVFVDQQASSGGPAPTPCARVTEYIPTTLDWRRRAVPAPGPDRRRIE